MILGDLGCVWRPTDCILYMLQLPSLSWREGDSMQPITMIYPYVPPPLQSLGASPGPPHWQGFTNCIPQPHMYYDTKYSLQMGCGAVKLLPSSWVCSAAARVRPGWPKLSQSRSGSCSCSCSPSRSACAHSCLSLEPTACARCCISHSVTLMC